MMIEADLELGTNASIRASEDDVYTCRVSLPSGSTKACNTTAVILLGRHERQSPFSADRNGAAR